jgi:hypothetical protein
VGLSQKGAASNGPGNDPLCFETSEATAELRSAHLKELYESPLGWETIAYPQVVIRAIFPYGSGSLASIHVRTFAVGSGVRKSFVQSSMAPGASLLATRSGFA